MSFRLDDPCKRHLVKKRVPRSAVPHADSKDLREDEVVEVGGRNKVEEGEFDCNIISGSVVGALARLFHLID